MPNFKVGDRVILVRNSGFAKEGMTGTIAFDDGSNCAQYAVEFDKKVQEGHSCVGHCPSGNGRWLSASSIKLISKFAVGQIYRSTCEDGEKGNIVKIVDASGKFIKYDTIRGIKRATIFFNDSTFANGLVLLTGKQIGEAIKAFDAKKAEPSGVKEVKRRAKKGEYLKVVDASTDEGYNYSNGDILKCTFVGSCGIQARSGAKYGTLVDHEYAVLEGYKPENNGRIYIGGKHVWTPEEVERAKTIVLDTIREIYEESEGSVVFSRDVYSDKIFDAYLIEKGYSKLGYRPLDDAVIAHKARKGTAKCSPTDEPNVWIGKCVALCKALHKPIPSFIMGD